MTVAGGLTGEAARYFGPRCRQSGMMTTASRSRSGKSSWWKTVQQKIVVLGESAGRAITLRNDHFGTDSPPGVELSSARDRVYLCLSNVVCSGGKVSPHGTQGSSASRR